MACDAAASSLPPDLLKNHRASGLEVHEHGDEEESAGPELRDELDESAVLSAMKSLEQDGLTRDWQPSSLVDGNAPQSPLAVAPLYPTEKVIQLQQTSQIRELQTVLRDRSTSRGDFIFYADRLIRLVVEEGLNSLPYVKANVTTPTGGQFQGLRYLKGNCGVSIMRSGEAMERGLRDCCRSIRIGKIMVQTDEETHQAKVFYSKFPPGVQRRKVLLMYPIICSGNTVIKAVQVLHAYHVEEANVLVLSLFATATGLGNVLRRFPNLTILTSEVHQVVPDHFGRKYFGTD